MENWTKWERKQRNGKKRKALELAARTMNRISGEMQSQAGERLNQRISEITEQITGGKYQKVWMDTELNLHLLGEAGRVSVSQVSRGTAEQLYFALRMAASELLCEEKFPLVLDDTFVCYDDVRLERTLNWLAESGRQVLLFTRQGREERALKKAVSDTIKSHYKKADSRRGDLPFYYKNVPWDA